MYDVLPHFQPSKGTKEQPPLLGQKHYPDRAVYEKRLRNELTRILEALAPYRDPLHGVAVESTYKLALVDRWAHPGIGRGMNAKAGVPPAQKPPDQRVILWSG